MALIDCHECKKTVSDQATSCPHCGAPVAKSAASKNLNKSEKKAESKAGTVVLVLFIIFCVGKCSSFDRPKPAAAQAEQAAPKEKTCVKDDLQCIGDRGIVAAGVYCAPQVEKLAKHSVKWTDGMLEMKFSRFRWRNKQAGQVTYVGGKAEFQNGFGAWTPVIYECDLDADEKTILEVRVREGRLP